MAFIGSQGVKSAEEKIKEPSLGIDNALGVGVKVDRRDGRTLLARLMRKAIHTLRTENEILADDEIRRRNFAEGGTD